MLPQLADQPAGPDPEAFPSADVPSADTPSDDSPSVSAIATEVLEVVLDLDQVQQVAAVDDLRARIPVPADRLAAAIDRLVDDAVVAWVADGAAAPAVAFTTDGRERAVTAVRRHRLAERLLSDVIGLDWWKVHHEAERFDGAISDDVEARLVELLGDPGTCPHGNPIPGSVNQPVHPGAVVLADAPVGPVHVIRITETLEGDDEALQLLQQCGFMPGRDAEIKHREHGWVEVAGTVRDAALPPHVVAHTWVSPL